MANVVLCMAMFFVLGAAVGISIPNESKVLDKQQFLTSCVSDNKKHYECELLWRSK
jgi:hypothetical protein